jgi:hypothetical protein
MFGSNTPTEFTITPDNLLDTLMEWLPGQFEKMRLYQAGTIKVSISGVSTLECQYSQTVGGEKFHIADVGPYGASGSCYYDSLGADDDVIMDYSVRINRIFGTLKKINEIRKEAEPKPLELKMVFTPGPFEPVG